MSEANFSQRVLIRSILGRRDGVTSLEGRTLKVGGWVKRGRFRGLGSCAVVDLNDGSCLADLQLIISSNFGPVSLFTPTGTCLHVEGVLQILSETHRRINCLRSAYMLNVSKVIHVGQADPAEYPLPKTGLTLEFLRDYVHLRPRSDFISAILRIRNALSYATHLFFQRHDFLYVHTPCITTIDCEGAGEMFPVTTLINEAERIEMDLIENPPPYQEEVAMADEAWKPAITSAVVGPSKAKENFANVEKRFNLKPGIPKKDGKVEYGQDFFARHAFLTVFGQLQVETFACALSSVYTFGPTFRTEHSHTSRHLEEFWMVEPEIAFADIEDDMKCAEEYVKFLCRWLLDNCLDDMAFMDEKFDTNAIRRLEMVASTNFLRLSYTEAVAILEDAVSKGYKFESKVEWGIDLASEHEKYLTETEFESPVIVYDYPKETKAFYMKLNSDKKTVAAMDVLVPKVGKLIGGSQREENYKVIKERILEMGLPLEPYEWYLDLRRYGTVQHSGFCLVFEQMILFATGIDNIRDVIPFPRLPRRADV